MQKRLAGMKPNCAVRTAITQIIALLVPATTQPCQSFLPTRMVERIVSTQM